MLFSACVALHPYALVAMFACGWARLPRFVSALVAVFHALASPFSAALRATRGVLVTAYMQEEVERLEKIKQEFVEVDGDDSAPDDADMMAELRKRLAAEAATGSDPTDATGTDDPDAPPTPPPAGGSDKS